MHAPFIFSGGNPVNTAIPKASILMKTVAAECNRQSGGQKYSVLVVCESLISESWTPGL